MLRCSVSRFHSTCSCRRGIRYTFCGFVAEWPGGSCENCFVIQSLRRGFMSFVQAVAASGKTLRQRTSSEHFAGQIKSLVMRRLVGGVLVLSAEVIWSAC